MNPLLPYYGGKARLAPWLISLMPDHHVYCEPFAGGAAVLFAKSPAKVEVLNDLNESVINCYRCFQEEGTARRLWRRLQATPYSRAEHKRAQRIVNDQRERRYVHDRETLAWATVVDFCMSMGSIQGSGFAIQRAKAWGPIGGERWNVRREVRQAARRLRFTVIEQLDALECIRKWDSPNTLLYIDPPYPGADQGHYSGYTSENFAELVELLDGCESSFLLSNYEQSGVPSEWERFEKVVPMTTGRKNQTRTEVVWRRLSEAQREQPGLFENVR